MVLSPTGRPRFLRRPVLCSLSHGAGEQSIHPSRTRTARDQSVPIFANPSSVSWYLYSLTCILESESGTHTSNPRFILVSWVSTDANTELTVSVPAFSSLALLLSSESRLENSTSVIGFLQSLPAAMSSFHRSICFADRSRPAGSILAAKG